MTGSLELRIAEGRDLVGAVLRITAEVVDAGAGADVAELERAASTAEAVLTRLQYG